MSLFNKSKYVLFIHLELNRVMPMPQYTLGVHPFICEALGLRFTIWSNRMRVCLSANILRLLDFDSLKWVLSWSSYSHFIYPRQIKVKPQWTRVNAFAYIIYSWLPCNSFEATMCDYRNLHKCIATINQLSLISRIKLFWNIGLTISDWVSFAVWHEWRAHIEHDHFFKCTVSATLAIILFLSCVLIYLQRQCGLEDNI